MRKIIQLFVIMVCCIIFFSACKNQKKVSDKKDFIAAEISEIVINNTSWNLKILASSDEKIHVSYEGTIKGENAGISAIQQDNVLTVAQTEEDEGAEQQFAFGKGGEIILYLPKEISLSTNIKNGSGEMQIESVNFLELSLDDNSGYVTISDITAEKANLFSNSGDIKIKNSLLPNAEIKTTSAYVTIKNTDINSTTIITNSGEVGISGVEAYKDLSIQTRSGDVSVSHKETPANLKFNISTGASDITMQLKDIAYTTNTESCKQGSIGNKNYYLEITSNNGTISVK